jgi:hypothetical protein
MDGSGSAMDVSGSTMDGGASTTDGSGTADGEAGGGPATPILGTLNTIATIGSTIDPNNNPTIDPTGSGTNPYGLVIAPVSAAPITAGDLVACNFNNGPNTVQGSPPPNTQGQEPPSSDCIQWRARMRGETPITLRNRQAYWGAVR